MNFLNINQLKAAELEELFQLADNFYIPDSNTFKQDQILADKKVLNLFFEPSTRTKLSLRWLHIILVCQFLVLMK